MRLHHIPKEQRWGKDGENRYCPHCGVHRTYKFKSGKLYKCADCRKQFTVTVGTILRVATYHYINGSGQFFSILHSRKALAQSSYLNI